VKLADELPNCTSLHSAIAGGSARTAMAPKGPYQEGSITTALLLKSAVTMCNKKIAKQILILKKH
jgi:hypothetical protein